MIGIKKTIIVFLFMIVVAFLNAASRKGETVLDIINSKWKESKIDSSEVSEDASKPLQQQVDISSKRKESKMDFPEVSEDVLKPLQQQVEQHISQETDSWGATSHLMGSEYIGNYVLYGKSGERVEYPYQIYLVYRVWIVLNDDYSDIIPYYYLVNFPDVSLSEAEV